MTTFFLVVVFVKFKMSEFIRKRAPNFSAVEKNFLLNIINSFKTIIECKKTDATTWRQKDEAWSKVTEIFNAKSPGNYPRSKECLKNFFDNIKKNVRKEIASERREVYKTGGGAPDIKPSKDPTIDLALNIINKKTVYGLANKFDSDDCTPQQNIQDFEDMEIEVITTSDHSYHIDYEEFDDEALTKENEDLISQPDCSKDNARILLETKTNEPKKPQPEPGCSKNNPIFRETPKTNQTKKRDWGNFCAGNLREPPAEELQHNWTKRRRPNIQCLSSSKLQEEYLELAQIKKDFFRAEKENSVRRLERDKEIFQLQMKKLKLEIKIKEVEFKKLEDTL